MTTMFAAGTAGPACGTERHDGDKGVLCSKQRLGQATATAAMATSLASRDG